MKNILIVEDNAYSMEKAVSLIKTIPDTAIIKAKNSEQAYKYALEYTIDLFIVDIVLSSEVIGDISGARFVENIREIDRYRFVPIIFTTCMEDPKLYAYAHLHCYSYFEKPYDSDELLKTIKSALKYKSIHNELEYYCFKKDGIICPIKTKNIVYFKIEIPYLYIHCSDGDIFSAPYKSTKKILLELKSDNFVKCNQHMIINRRHIQNIDSVNRYVTLSNDFGTHEIGQRMVKRVIEIFE